MLHTLSLLLPALLPSWRFFDEIAPSPRIEVALSDCAEAESGDWREFRPLPARVAPKEMLKRLFWNPRWNESLFLVSCAERAIAHESPLHRREIAERIRADLAASGDPALPYFRFRLIFLYRDGASIERHELYVSPPRRWSAAS